MWFFSVLNTLVYWTGVACQAKVQVKRIQVLNLDDKVLRPAIEVRIL